MTRDLKSPRRQNALGDERAARLAERIARVVAEPPALFSPARDERKSKQLSVPAVVGHAEREPVGGDILFLAGPTASGKSALALELAERLNAEIVNADSMQVYADLEVISARPPESDLLRATHRLYGHVDAAEPYSVGRWSQEALGALEDAAARGRPVIVTGGTGLYFRALTEGLADVPDPGPEAEEYARDVLNTRGIEALYALAQHLDPDGAAQVAPTDRQRLMRLVAVARGVGAPLSALRAATAPPVLPGAWLGVVLDPDRRQLATRIEMRARRMIEQDAAEEAARLVRRGLPADRPAMKALGVADLAALHAGEISREEALERLTGDTRRYAKRQLTWFRHQTPGWRRLPVGDVSAALAEWERRGAI